MKSYLRILFSVLLTGLMTPCFAEEVQLESFDDLVVSGWYDTRGSGLMIQAPPGEVNEGSGSMRIRFEDRPTGLWDIVPRKVYPGKINLTPIANTALSFWVWSDLVDSSCVRQLIIYQAGKTARFDVPLASEAGWRKITCPVSEFFHYPGVDVPIYNFSQIDTVDFWCSAWPDGGNSIYIDDLRLEYTSYVQDVQIDIERVQQMPNIPSPYIMRDWKQVAIDYDAFVFDFTKTGDYLPLIWWDTSQVNFHRDGFGMPSYVGRFDQTGGTAHESINCMGAVLGATLVGIDKSNQNGYNWVLMEENYFSSVNGENLYLNNLWGDTGYTFWYETLPSILFYQLAYYYPGIGDMDSEFIITANRWYDACVAMGGNTNPWTVPNFNHTAFDFDTMTPYDNGVWLEPDAPAAIGWVEYMAYVKLGDQKYLDAADWSIQFIENQSQSPLYDVLLGFAPYIAARMNAEQGRNYDVDKILNFCFYGNQYGWGIQAYNWGGYDVGGLAGNDRYVFEMESLNYAGAMVPLVRYDQRYARAIGKYMLNLANSVRLFYPDTLPETHQTSFSWADTYDPDNCIGYEGLKSEKWTYDKANSEDLRTGSIISGDYSTTHVRDNINEVLEEETLPGGEDGLEHVWHISLASGYFYQIVIKSRISDGGDADSGFNYYYSNNPSGPYTYLFTVTSTTDIFNWQPLINVGSDLYIKVEDTDRVAGNDLHDRIYVDEIYVEVRDNTIAPFASGDPISWGWGNTDLGLYGSSYIGILGGIVSTTNVDKILQLDLLTTDYYHDAAYPTFLYFNPYASTQVVDINVGAEPVDLYDTVSQTFLKTDISGVTDFNIPADSAVLVVLAPAGGIVTIEGNKKLINGVVVDYKTNTVFSDCAQIQVSPLRLTGDIVGDCIVDMRDLAELVERWLEQGTCPGRVDINGDNIVNFEDLNSLAGNWFFNNNP